MTKTAHKPATYADLERVPSHLVAEILFGHLVTHPRPVPRHGAAAVSLVDELTGPFQKGRGGGPGGWVFVAEPELHLGPHVAVPDIAGWRKDRLVGAVEKAWIEVAPDWVCEILSPSTEKSDRGDKRRIYALYGVEHLWHLDPRTHLLEVFRRQNKDWLLTDTFQDEEPVTAPPFDAITSSLGVLWPFDTPGQPPEPAE